MSGQGTQWLGTVLIAVFSTLVVRALEAFFLRRGCCESECNVQMRRRRADMGHCATDSYGERRATTQTDEGGTPRPGPEGLPEGPKVWA